eukprot:COSAG01_NODE_4892_length_4648_cov_3.866344_6_plen_86_part_00
MYVCMYVCSTMYVCAPPSYFQEVTRLQDSTSTKYTWYYHSLCFSKARRSHVWSEPSWSPAAPVIRTEAVTEITIYFCSFRLRFLS